MKKFKMKSLKNRNSALKIFSLIFAIFLWSYVRSEVDPERTITFRSVPVRYENMAEIKSNNLTIISPEEAKVDVTLKGKQSNISKLKRENVIASVDLSGYYAGEYNIPIKIQVDANNILVDKKEPETIAFKIDENITKTMTADIKTIGKLKENYVLGNIKQQEEIEVVGPKTFVDSIDKLVALVDVSKKSESTVVSAPIIAYDKEGEIIEEVSTNPKSIDIEIPILKTETVPVKLNVVGNIPDGIDEKQFSVEPNSITIKGNSALIKKITEIETEEISVDKLLSGQVPIEVKLPEGIALVDKDIRFVASAYPIEIDEQTIEIPLEDIKAKNLSENLEIDFVDNKKNIKISLLPKDPLSERVLSKEDVYASVDFTNLEEGEHELELDISVPESFKITGVEPSSIVVNLVKKKGF